MRQLPTLRESTPLLLILQPHTVTELITHLWDNIDDGHHRILLWYLIICFPQVSEFYRENKDLLPRHLILDN